MNADDEPATSELKEEVQRRLDANVRPFLQGHGGDVEVLGIHHGVVDIRMFAACGACELQDVTFAGRIRAEIKRIPGVDDVVCASVPFTPQRLDRIAAFFGSIRVRRGA